VDLPSPLDLPYYKIANAGVQAEALPLKANCHLT
jgi:hypothetical protein